MITKNSDGVSVSQAFIDASTAVVSRACARVDVLWTDVNVDPFLSVSSDFNNYGIQSSVDHGTDILKQVVDSNERPTRKYAILDGSWALGDDKGLAPYTQNEVLNNQIGWYSSNVSDVSGNFAEPHPSVSVNFGSGGRAVSNIRVAGDSLLNQYPVDFVVNIYDSEDAILFTKSVTGNTGLTWLQTVTGVADAVRIELVISKWSTANTVAKILEFFSVERDSFQGDEIITMDLLEEREAKKGTSPVGNVSLNELTLKLQNISITASDGVTYEDPFTVGNSAGNRFYNFLRPNRRIDAYLGFYVGEIPEYVKVGTFWTTGDWRCNEMDSSATVTAHDRLSLLKSHTFKCPEISAAMANLNLKQAAEFILTHAKENIPLHDLVWDISDDLENFTVPLLWFGKGSYFDAIKAVAEACMGYAWMSKNDVLCMRSYLTNSSLVDLAITRDNYIDKSQPSNVNEMKNYVEVEVSRISRDSSEIAVVYDDSTVFTVPADSEIEVNLSYKNTPVERAVASLVTPQDGLEIVASSIEYLSYGCTLRLRNTYSVPLSSAITVSAYEYTNSSAISETYQDDDLIAEYGRKEEKVTNHLIQSRSMAALITVSLVENYGILRRDVNLDWVGDPRLEVGDVVSVPEYQENIANFVVVKNDWAFDGTLSCKTSARKVVS